MLNPAPRWAVLCCLFSVVFKQSVALLTLIARFEVQTPVTLCALFLLCLMLFALPFPHSATWNLEDFSITSVLQSLFFYRFTILIVPEKTNFICFVVQISDDVSEWILSPESVKSILLFFNIYCLLKTVKSFTFPLKYYLLICSVWSTVVWLVPETINPFESWNWPI